MDVLAVVAAVTGILAFVYVLIIGQKSIPEWWREKSAGKHRSSEQHQLGSLVAPSTRTIPHNLPHRSDFVCREREKRHEILRRLQEKPCLVVVDNFETVMDDAVQDFILNLPEPSKCLITSRTQSLRQARAVSIRGLAKEETLLLIENEGDRLGLDLTALTANQVNFRRFYEATGGAPLAIKWSLGQIRQRGQSIDGVLSSLHGAQG